MEKASEILFDKDEWESWREHPLTRWFLDHFTAEKAAEAKQTFIDYAWERKEIDPIYHAYLLERARTLEQMRELTYEDIEAI